LLLTFVAANYQSRLQCNQLASFEEAWARHIDWFEEPNHRRGGWSGVGTLQLQETDGQAVTLFVKKQQNHGRKTWRHPIQGEPTFKREFARLRFLEAHHFLAPKVVFYGVAEQAGKQRAVLATEALAGFEPLDAVLAKWYPQASKAEKRALMQRVAAEIRRFHALGLMHRALYPKHIFVKNAGKSAEIAVIDLEKARFSWFSWYRAYFDLSALNRHVEGVNRTQRLRFFKRYLNIEQLGWLSKCLCRLIMRRSQR
jgi:Lipopolysaccharide kinase (Kdo/WaaP) family